MNSADNHMALIRIVLQSQFPRLEPLSTSQNYGKVFMNADAIATTTANTDSASEAQPRNSLLAFWRRLTSISVKNQSPVSRAQPDQWCANCSSDINLNSFDVNVGLEDIDKFLSKIESRCGEITAPWNGPYGRSKPQDLSAIGHLIAIDVPRLVALVRKLQNPQK